MAATELATSSGREGEAGKERTRSDSEMGTSAESEIDIVRHQILTLERMVAAAVSRGETCTVRRGLLRERRARLKELEVAK